MGYSAHMTPYGGKGGSQSQRQPVEAPDTLSSVSYANLLDMVSEGEIAGLVNGQASIFLEETSASSGTFSGFSWAERKGTQDQRYIPGFPSAEADVPVGVELRQGVPFVRTVNKPQLSALRVRIAIPRLTTTNASNGDTKGGSVRYTIETRTDGGAWQIAVDHTTTGKTTQRYVKTHRVDLPNAEVGWDIRITRVTANSTSDRVQNQTIIDSLTEVIDAKFRYPNSAIIATKFDARSFQSIPKRSFHLRGRLIQVPSNYDPESRTYSGIWDGTFKVAYTNNPAWVYRDLVLHKRYGLGNRITAAQLDKYELYRISQYCDQMLPDGKGGTEPRFTCNIYLQERQSALKVLQDIASIFRGMSYWGAGQAFVSGDMPMDPEVTFTNADVVDGSFSYPSAPMDTRYSVVNVSWNDPADFYRQKVEYVEDRDAIAKWGINKLDLTAFGCSSQGQAQRAGRYALITNQIETDTVVFTVPLKGLWVRPGQTFRVADNDLAGRRIGGRVVAATLNSITVDSVGQAQIGDVLHIMMPTGKTLDRTVSQVAGRTLSFTQALPSLPGHLAVWAISSDDLVPTQWRCVSVVEKENYTFQVTASRYNESKYDAIELGTKIETPPISVIPPSVQAAPTNIRVTSDWMIEQTMAVTTMRVEWDAAENAVAYSVEWRKDDGDWVTVPRTGTTSVEVQGIYAGDYLVRVNAYNPLDTPSPWAYSALTTLAGKEGTPPALANVTTTSLVFGILLRWSFLAGSGDALRTEFRYNTAPDDETAINLGDYAYPIASHQLMGLGPGVRLWFQGRIVDRSGNVGPWSPWVDGLSSNQASEILDYIKGQISELELTTELLEEIEKISGPDTLPGSVNERIKELNDQIESQIDSINAQLAEIAGAPEWAAGVQYQAGDIVKHEGKLYRAYNSNIDSEPPSADWEKIGDYASIGEAVAAMAVQINNIQTEVTNINGELVAMSHRIDGIFAQVNPPMAGSTGDYAGSTEVFAGVWSEQTARAEADSALAQNIDAVAVRVGENEARIFQEQTARVSADEALAQSIEALRAEVETEVSGQLAQVRADLVTEQTVRANADGALSQSIEALSASVTTETGRLDAAIQNEQIARVNADTAMAQTISTVQSSVGQNTASIQTQAQTIADMNGDLSALYTVKLQANMNGTKTFAGFGLGIEESAGILQSTFIVAADRFVIATTMNGSVTDAPFAVQGGSVYIKSAFIQDGSINMLKIGDNLQSDDYVAGQRGWKLWKSGNFEINGSVAGQGRMTMTNQLLRVYDSAGTMRIRLGIWA